MNQHNITPDHKSKEWLLYCLNRGYSQRQMGAAVGVSAHTIRLWLKKHDIKWRSISESLLGQSDKVSERAKKVWADPHRRKKQSEKMVEVQSKRKRELSESAKKNWANNRDNIMAGIQNVARDPHRLAKLSELSKEKWQDQEYRDAVYSSLEKIRNDPEYKRKLSEGTSKNSYNKMTTDEFVEQSVNLWGDRYSYDHTNYTLSLDKVTITCNNCGNNFNRIARDHLRGGHGCPSCNISKGQFEIYEFLSDYTECVLNDRSTISPLEIDIYVPNKSIGIEFHGLYWHSYNRQESINEKHAHHHKMCKCRDNNITLLQIFEHEWQYKSDIIKSMIKNKLGLSQPINARSLKVKWIDDPTFFRNNHLSGHRPAKTTIALTNGDNIIMATSFSKHKEGYEIIRMATSKGMQVRGGLGRLLKAFIRKFSPKAIYTFADLRYATGIGYQKVGFTKTHETKPGYFYYKGNEILSRQRCQKHKLPKLLGDSFNSDLTEAENMFLHGYRRVWDAGHLKLKR